MKNKWQNLSLFRKTIFIFRLLANLCLILLFILYYTGIFVNAGKYIDILLFIGLIVLCIEQWNKNRKNSILGSIVLVIILLLTIYKK